MKNRTVFQFFVNKCAVFIGTALFHGFHDIGAVAAFLNRIFPIRIRQVQAERPFHEIPERLVAADILNFVAVAVEFHDTHRNGIKGFPGNTVVYVGKEGKVIEIDPSHSVIISGLLPVFKAFLFLYVVSFQNLIGRRGLHKIETLQLGTPDFLQKTDMVCRFHAFTNSINPQGNSHLHHFPEDDLPVFPFIKPPHETHVKLDQVKLHALQYIQGGIPAAEVIHPYLETLGAETFDLFFHVGKIAAHHTFRDFDNNQLPVNLRFLHKGADLLHQVTSVKVRPGKVNGNRQSLYTSFLGVFQAVQHLPYHAQVQLMDQHGFFQHRNKQGGHLHTPYRVMPAGQRLEIADLAVGGADDGLVIHLDPAFFNGLVKVVDDCLAVFLLRHHIHIKKRIVGLLDLFLHVRRHPGTVAGRADLHGFDPVRINPDPDRQGFPAVCLSAFFDHRVKPLLQSLLRSENGEMILGKTGTVFTAEMLCQNSRHSADQTVALGETVPTVKCFQTCQVQKQNGGTGFLFPHPFTPGLGQFIEICHIGQPGQVVKIPAPVLALFCQKAVQGLVQDALIHILPLYATALMGIPGQAEAHFRFRIDGPAVRMNDNIILIF